MLWQTETLIKSALIHYAFMDRNFSDGVVTQFKKHYMFPDPLCFGGERLY